MNVVINLKSLKLPPSARNLEISLNTFIGGSGWSDPNMTLNPGEGVIFQNNTSALTRSFVGQVQQGYNVTGVPNYSSIHSATIPRSGRVVADLGLPVLTGDSVTQMINGVNTTYTYGGGTWSPEEPMISMGESFWNNKGIGLFWARNFLVWP